MQRMSSHFQLVDHHLGGGDALAKLMAEVYTNSGSWEEVSRRLLIDHGEQVSGQTLRRWARQLDSAAHRVAS